VSPRAGAGQRLGFIGLGRMGRPLAANLLSAGFALTVWGRSPGPAEALAALGARRAGSPAEVAAASEVVLTCLPGPAEVEGVIGEALGGAAPGTVFIDLSTVDPGTSRRLARAAGEARVHFLDAPVSGGVAGAEAGTLTIMVGGEREVFERCRPVLAALGERLHFMGPAGSGSLAKCCNQLLAGIGYLAVAEALLLGTRGGLDAALLVEALAGSSGRSRVLEQAAPRILGRDFRADFTLELAWKDLRCALAAAEQAGLALRLAPLAGDLYREACEAGLGGQDQAAVVVPLERSSGTTVGGS
jgi:3-hydroxyisobutyrate dehydrogenase-like beta-hydroxyacid dehydrogenase